MTCVDKAEAHKVMKEVHGGSCDNHSRGEALAIKIKCERHADNDQGLRKFLPIV